MSRTSFLLISIHFSLGIGSIASAQDDSIALVRNELNALRNCLKLAEQETGLHALSEDGKDVLRDVANVAVTIDDAGSWGYRHFGNNRKLHKLTVAPDDRSCVENAMDSEEFKTLLGTNSESVEALTLMVADPNNRTEVGSYLQQLAEPSNLAAPVKEHLSLRVGEAISRVEGDQRGELLNDPKYGQTFRDAWSKSIQLEAERLSGLADAKPAADERLFEFVEKLITTSDDMAFPMADQWTEQIHDGKTIYSVELTPELKAYAVWKDGTMTPVSTTTMMAKLKNEDVKLYIAEAGDETVELIEPTGAAEGAQGTEPNRP